jgi:hypothetical protein
MLAGSHLSLLTSAAGVPSLQLSDELFMMPTLDDSHPLTSAEDARRSGYTTANASGAGSKPGAGSSRGLVLFGNKPRSTTAGTSTTQQQEQPTESGGAMLQMEEEEEQQW